MMIFHGMICNVNRPESVFLTVLKPLCYNALCVRRHDATLRGGAVAARQAHNLKVLSSNLSPATLSRAPGRALFLYHFIDGIHNIYDGVKTYHI
jgi:hypothetical protein